MPINDWRAPGPARQPRLRVLCNGESVPLALSASVTSTNNFSADRFDASFAAPLTGTGSFAWWEAQTAILLDVQIGMQPLGQPSQMIAWQSIVTGQVDATEVEFTRNRVSVHGRDLTARMIDARTAEAHTNRTSSEIVAAIAASHGLTAQVAATTTPVGRYFAGEHDRLRRGELHRNTTEWDLIVTLARFEQFDAFVQGTTLYFQPWAAPDADPYVLHHEVDAQGRQIGNVLDLSATRNLTTAKGVHVIVRSWHAKQAAGLQVGYPTDKPVNAGRDPTAQQYVFTRPNLTRDEALKLAKSYYDEIIRHERRIKADLVADLALTPRAIVRLEGTGTGFDQTYYPIEITRRIGIEDYAMTLSAVNHSPVFDAAAS